ncbi:MAG: glycosyltransferase [Nanoarchaeota archaeon]
MKKIAIIIPAYNEERRIGPTLQSYSQYFDEIKKKKLLDYKIIVVINNTNDKTPEIVEKYHKNNKNIEYFEIKRGGKGGAIIEGFKKALRSDFDYLAFIDADMATSPESFYELVKNMEENHAVIASRYMPGSVVKPKQSMQRILASRIFNTWIKATLFLNYNDTQCGAKIFQREAIERVLPHLSVLEYAFDVDLLYTLKKLGYSAKEVPTVWSDKNYSKVNFVNSGPKMALTVLKLRMLNSPLKIFFRSEKK